MRTWKAIGLGMVGSFLGVGILVGLAYYQDIFTVEKDGTIHWRVTANGNIGIPNTPDTTALLDLSSTSKGFLMPRMTTAQRDAITSPATGLEIYNTTTNRAERYTGAAWKPVGISNVGAGVYHSANQSISNLIVTVLSFDGERFDADTIHDTVTNNTRLTCKTAGKYLIWGTVIFDVNATGARFLGIKLNGTTRIAGAEHANSGASNYTRLNVARVFELSVNDYVELDVSQGSGGALNILSSAQQSPEFGMTLLQE